MFFTIIGWLIVMSIGLGMTSIGALCVYSAYYFGFFKKEFKIYWQLWLTCLLFGTSITVAAIAYNPF